MDGETTGEGVSWINGQKIFFIKRYTFSRQRAEKKMEQRRFEHKKPTKKYIKCLLDKRKRREKEERNVDDWNWILFRFLSSSCVLLFSSVIVDTLSLPPVNFVSLDIFFFSDSWCRVKQRSQFDSNVGEKKQKVPSNVKHWKQWKTFTNTLKKWKFLHSVHVTPRRTTWVYIWHRCMQQANTELQQ